MQKNSLISAKFMKKEQCNYHIQGKKTKKLFQNSAKIIYILYDI